MVWMNTDAMRYIVSTTASVRRSQFVVLLRSLSRFNTAIDRALPMKPTIQRKPTRKTSMTIL